MRVRNRFIWSATIAAAVALLAASGTPVRAMPAGVPAFAMASPAVVHHSFTLAPGGSAAFVLPVVGKPVRVDVAIQFVDGTNVTPTELMSAIVEQNPQTGVISSIGTNSDGTIRATDTNLGAPIASIFQTGQAVPDAILIVTTPPPFKLGIYQYPQTTSSANYAVTLTY